MKRIFFLTLMLIVACLAALGWWFRADLSHAWGKMSKPLLVIGKKVPQPDPLRYEVVKAETERWRLDLAKRYRAAQSKADRDAVIAEARGFLEVALPDLMSCWLGTPWDFNGTSEKPGEGQVACGYFVATVLRDAGFKVNRYKLAREASENILLTFLPRKELERRVGVSYEGYAEELRKYRSGVRIVGLDTHVGFLVSGPEGFRFVHSSGSRPWCVVDESEQEAEVLKRSNYRVHGSLTDNPDVIRRWLAGEKITVRKSS
ncbi:hypothetical protein ACFQY0_10630 [Haloferula chungangensis]|uniref:DUF1287 domain-containing protein n=1 Tax=Haloferula chungangensis TaxID=1048331 RepID=A0ABW2L8L8_9BACT